MMHVSALSLQSCLTLRDLMDCSPAGSSVQGILQARILEWLSVPSSGGSSRPRGMEPTSPVTPALQVDSLQSHQGSPAHNDVVRAKPRARA